MCAVCLGVCPIFVFFFLCLLVIGLFCCCCVVVFADLFCLWVYVKTGVDALFLLLFVFCLYVCCPFALLCFCAWCFVGLFMFLCARASLCGVSCC